MDDVDDDVWKRSTRSFIPLVPLYHLQNTNHPSYPRPIYTHVAQPDDHISKLHLPLVCSLSIPLSMIDTSQSSPSSPFLLFFLFPIPFLSHNRDRHSLSRYTFVNPTQPAKSPFLPFSHPRPRYPIQSR